MKKIYYLALPLLIFIMILSITNNKLLAEKMESKIFNEETIITKDYDIKIDQIKKINNLVNNFLIISNQEIYISDNLTNDLHLIINGTLIDNIYYDNYLYLLIYNNYYQILKYDLSNYKIKNKLGFDEEISSINIIDNTIFVTGRVDNHGFIRNYNLDLNDEFLLEYMMNNSNNDLIKNIEKVGIYYYAEIYKEAEVTSTDIYSTDIEGTKCHLIKFNPNLTINKVLYLDEGGSDEEIIDIYYLEDRIFLSLDSDEKHYYVIDYDFNIINYLNHHLVRSNLIPNYQDDSFISLANDNEISIYQNEKLIHELNYQYYDDYQVVNGFLYIYVRDNKEIKIIKIKEYEILKNDPSYNNRYHMVYERMNNIEVKSLFGNLNKEISDIKPYFDKTINGIYDATYNIKFQDESSIKINNQIIIDEYTNFIDGGIYPTGFMLEFFGHASIDDKIIYNGHIMNQQGNYLIKIKDANETIKTYKIHIIDNYYQKKNIVHLTSDDIVRIGEITSLDIILNEPYQINKLIINDQSYNNYHQIDNHLYINFNNEELGYKSYYIEYLTYNIASIERKMIIDKLYNVTVINQNEVINIEKIIDYQDLKLNIKNNDYQRNFMYLKISNNDYDNLIIVNNNNLNLSTISLKISIIYLDYDQKMIEYELINMDSDNKINIDFNFNYQSNYLDELNINLSLPKDKSNIKKLDILKQNNLIYYEDRLDNSFLLTMIISSIILIIILIILVIIKKHFKKKKHSI